MSIELRWRRAHWALACSGLWVACASSAPSSVSSSTPNGGSAGASSAGASSAGAGHNASSGAGPVAGSSGAAQATAGAGSGGASIGGASGAGPSGGAGQGSPGAPAGGASNSAGAAGATVKPLDVTFFVVADTHADPPPSSDLQPEARAIAAVANSGAWPIQIDGQDTHFKGGAIGKPRGVVFVGDLTGWGTAPTELTNFRHYFEAGNSADAIPFPAYLGLGNHDLDSADRAEPLASQYRGLEWGYVESRHKGPNAPIPVTRFDAGSRDYSFDFDRLHLVQLHRFVGDSQYGLAPGLSFLADDLKQHASDARPVILFQHYGMDAFGSEPRWWMDTDRGAYREALKGYHVSGLIVGHSHAAFNYSWEGLRVFQVNNAKAEINAGNNDGNGSFAIVRVTDQQMDVVTCRWLDDSGKYELIGPYLSGPMDPGAAQ